MKKVLVSFYGPHAKVESTASAVLTKKDPYGIVLAFDLEPDEEYGYTQTRCSDPEWRTLAKKTKLYRCDDDANTIISYVEVTA